MKKNFCRLLIIASFIVILIVTGIFKAGQRLGGISVSRMKITGNEVAFCNSPFDKYDWSDCQIAVSLYNDKVYLTDSQKEKFLEFFLNIEVDKIGISDYWEYTGVGGSFSYSVEFGDGKRIGIYAMSENYLFIAQKAYRCYSGEKQRLLDEYAVEVYYAVRTDS